MLSSLEIENFKSWRKARLKFSKITGLFGTNSSGKSSLIQFLLLLKQTKETTDRTVSLDLNGIYVNLGAYADTVFAHDENLNVRWKLGFSTPDPLAIIDPSARRTKAFVRSSEVELLGEVGLGSTGPTGRRLAYHVGESQTFTLTAKRSDSSSYELKAAGGNFASSERQAEHGKYRVLLRATHFLIKRGPISRMPHFSPISKQLTRGR